MREQLLGYLIGALETDERDRVEQALKNDYELQRELELLHESLEPLAAADGDVDPPVGLAERTCQRVAAERRRKHQPEPLTLPERPAAPASWTLADLTVAAGIIVAAGMLLFPAMQYSRNEARLAHCQNNLRRVYNDGLAPYAERNRGYFPAIPASGNLNTAGMYAVKLVDDGYLPAENWAFCPGSSGCDETGERRIPAMAEVMAASGPQLAALQRRMGGDYGYNLGYQSAGTYQPVKNQSRKSFALMADSPCVDLDGHRSANHGGCGQNVLFEDGHVGYQTNCKLKDCGDHIYLNDDGQVAAGKHAQDAVVAESSARPMPVQTIGYTP